MLELWGFGEETWPGTQHCAMTWPGSDPSVLAPSPLGPPVTWFHLNTILKFSSALSGGNSSTQSHSQARDGRPGGGGDRVAKGPVKTVPTLRGCG